MVPSLLSQPPADLNTVPDGELLRRYLADRNSPALEALVRRHGGMVLGVCRRVLGDPHDAEDAFQATFLVFVRKASAVRPAEKIGPWLYGVATRTALKARALAARRRAREKQVDMLPDMAGDPQAGAPTAAVSADWLPLLDREVARLPAKYRLPVLLCELQGLSRADAARQLAIPEGTLSSRLARARALLRRRLSRRGAGTAVLVAAVLFPTTAHAAVPQALVETTVRAATSFATGVALTTPPAVIAAAVLAAMRTTRLAVLVAGLAIVLLLGGVGWLAARLGRPAAPVAVVDTRSDQEKLQGTWSIVAVEVDGVKDGPMIEEFKKLRITFEGDVCSFPADSKMVLDVTTNPKRMDLTCQIMPPPNNFMHGIYEVNGDDLKMCLCAPGRPDRPTDFAAAPDSWRTVFTLKRQPKVQ
jgi:RNA polymerase sigma factor (sigma-70 family)